MHKLEWTIRSYGLQDISSLSRGQSLGVNGKVLHSHLTSISGRFSSCFFEEMYVGFYKLNIRKRKTLVKKRKNVVCFFYAVKIMQCSLCAVVMMGSKDLSAWC